MKLENFLKEADAIWKKSKKIPLVVLDEATMMPRKSRDRFFTDVVDGNLPADLEVFFDVVSVTFYGTGRDFDIEYYPKAFIPLYA